MLVKCESYSSIDLNGRICMFSETPIIGDCQSTTIRYCNDRYIKFFNCFVDNNCQWYDSNPSELYLYYAVLCGVWPFGLLVLAN